MRKVYISVNITATVIATIDDGVEISDLEDGFSLHLESNGVTFEDATLEKIDIVVTDSK
jgi:hypothetical protein